MEPIAHFLTGACIARAGLNRKSAYATLTAVLASEAADLDVLWSFAGPVEGLKHHRGITHTFIAVPVVAGVTVAAVWLLHRWRKRREGRKALEEKRQGTGLPAPPSKARQPVHWGWLYVTALFSALSHLWLDWTNSYGLRPFYPFSARWYEGSFVFIVEPILWALALSALIIPWLLGLTDAEIGARRKAFRGRGWAIFALAGMVALWCWRWSEHAQAQAMVENLQITTAPVERIALVPYPVNPFRWHALLETSQYFQTAEVDTRTRSITSDGQRNVLFKPSATSATEAAKRTLLGKVYLDWGSWAVVRDLGPEPIPGSIAGLNPPDLPPNRQWTTVEFTDLRFTYPFLGNGGTARNTGLNGWVYIVDGHEDAGEVMAGRVQR
jgi:inner membrane protein